MNKRRPQARMETPFHIKARRMARRRTRSLLNALSQRQATLEDAVIEGYMLGSADTYHALTKDVDQDQPIDVEILMLPPPPEDIIDGEVLPYA